MGKYYIFVGRKKELQAQQKDEKRSKHTKNYASFEIERLYIKSN